MSENAPETATSAAPVEAAAGTPQPSLLGDLVELCKPSITGMNLLMALGGMAFAQHAGAGSEALSGRLVLLLALGSTLVVSSANTMNQVLERNSDGLMLRTASRPLPSGRIKTSTALWFGIASGLLSLAVLAAINWLTVAIAITAWLIYVFMYTPLKRVAPISLTVGALAGAAPPLMGWTAVTGSVGLGGALLFAILAVWQLPHFLAISLFRHEDYVRAEIRTVPAVRGDSVARVQAVAWCAALLPLSLVLVWQDLAGPFYGVAAAGLGLWFLGYSVLGLLRSAKPGWARRFFFVSIAYMPLLTLALCLDVALL
jgi:protoheme IX farnesyltransferase